MVGWQRFYFKTVFMREVVLYDSLEKIYEQFSYYFIFDEATTDDVTGYRRTEKNIYEKKREEFTSSW